MKKNFPLILLCLILLVVLSPMTVLAEVSVGLKDGDWIEYNVTYTGSPLDTYPQWIRIEIITIQGTSITADLTIERLDGSSDTNSGTFNLETGVLELLAIPSNLDVGDEFYHEDYGNIVIAGTEENLFAGAKRTEVYTTINQIELHWDKSTGILLQSDQSVENFNQKMLIDRTNMWQTQILGLEPNIFYIVILILIVIITFTTFFLIRRNK
jgi:hypothetical protein